MTLRWRENSFLAVYLRDQWKRVALLALLIAAGIGLQLANPQIIRYFIDTAASGGASQALLLAAALFTGASLLQSGFRLWITYLSQTVAWNATNRLREDLTLHCLRLDMDFHKRHSPGELIERIDGDVSQLANYFSEFALQVVGNFLLVAGILVLLYREGVFLGVGLTIFTVAAFFLLGLIQKISVRRWEQAYQASAEQYGFLEERIGGVEEIRSVGAEDYMLHRLYRLMRTYLERFRSAFLVENLGENLTGLLFAVGYAIALGLGVYLFRRGEVSVGTAYLAVYYVGMLADPVQNIRRQVQDFQKSTASLNRVKAILEEQPKVSPQPAHPERAAGLANGALRVEFRGVSFHYEADQDVLKGISLTLEPGKVLGVLGRTGSGKSTFSRLLFRLYDPTSGSICLNGVDLRDIPLAELRSRVGMVSQEVQLFAATLRENLTFFREDVSDDLIEASLGELGLLEWAKALPQGLDTPLSGSGGGLSAGEAQLLAFGRVYLKQPGLVILDEASSRLDPATESLLERAIDRLFSGRTAVIIAHRLSTVMRADEIAILEAGRVVEKGPRVLLASDPSSRFYRLLQTGLEEVVE